jgi:L-serine dehydratase
MKVMAPIWLLLAGVLGLSTSDERIPIAKQLAEESQLEYNFTKKFR